MLNEVAPMLLSSGQEVDVGITGYFSYHLFGQELYLTTSHIGLVIILLAFVVFALVANYTIRHADPYKPPVKFLNILELLVEQMDNLTRENMGEAHGHKFSNYIGTLFGFILICNISGLLGLRAPTADYGTTLGLALITFVLIHYNGFKYQKMKHITDLFHPLPLAPINIIGEFATPLSMSLRLFGNILSGTVMLGLIYGLLPKLLLLFGSPVLSLLHAYFDGFSGAIQTYVFCMLTMVFIAQNFDTEE